MVNLKREIDKIDMRLKTLACDVMVAAHSLFASTEIATRLEIVDCYSYSHVLLYSMPRSSFGCEAPIQSHISSVEPGGTPNATASPLQIIVGAYSPPAKEM